MLSSSKTSKQTDEAPFKSLNPISKRNEIQITQMTEDIKTLEKENEGNMLWMAVNEIIVPIWLIKEVSFPLQESSEMKYYKLNTA